MSSTAQLRSLNINNINPHVKEAKYAVRGELATCWAISCKALQRTSSYTTRRSITVWQSHLSQYRQSSAAGPETYHLFRQVLSLLEYPPLLENEDALKQSFGYKQDVIDRAKWLLGEVHSVAHIVRVRGAWRKSQHC
jgi:alanine transaminase